jgi:parallel beta-helix repeat protein
MILLVLGLIAAAREYEPVSHENTQVRADSSSSLSYTPSGPILIQSDADFEFQSWPGEGSSENPYIIEDLEIDEEHLCLTIVDTTAYFVVQNCQFTASIEASSATAVSFENVSHGTIYKCNVTGNIGIILDSSENINVSSNNFHSFAPMATSFGLRVVESIGCNISKNQFIGDGTGVRLHMSDNCSLTDNEFIGCGFDYFEVHNPKTPGGHGLNISDNLVNGRHLLISEGQSDTALTGSNYGQIWLFDCYNVSIVGGNFEAATRGVTFTNCENCSVVGSTISDCVITGIYFKESIQCRILYCTVVRNGKTKPSEFWAGGIIIYGYSNDYTILNSNVSFNYGHGVYVWEINHCTINSSLFQSNGGESFTLDASSDCNIHNNTFIDDGLLIKGNLEQSIHSISNNTVNGKPLGYFVNISNSYIKISDYGAIILVNSSRVDIGEGDFSQSVFGIQLVYCTDCEIKDFTTHGNRGYGIRLSYSYLCRIMSCIIKGGFDYGISLFESNNCSIESSIVHGCIRGIGIGLSNNTITGNILAYNDLTNLILGGTSSSNSIFGNKLGWADDSAIDYGLNNYFDDGVGTGNSWSDYDGVGIYDVVGSAGSIDHFPTVLAATSPATINTLESITFEVDSTGHSLDWSVQALYNATFEILKNNSIIQEDNVSTASIVVQLDELPVGTYLFEIRVSDILGGFISSSVLVTVTETTTSSPSSTVNTTTQPTTSTTSQPGDFDIFMVIILGGGIASVIVIVMVFMKTKQK